VTYSVRDRRSPAAAGPVFDDLHRVVRVPFGRRSLDLRKVGHAAPEIPRLLESACSDMLMRARYVELAAMAA
jgi:hypothetical protein